MLFPTLDYLLFLALTVAVYWALPRSARLLWLGLTSVAFYASWRLAYLPVLVGVTALAWGAALAAAGGRMGRGASNLATVALLGPLLFFKYWGWIANNLEALAGLSGLTVALPRTGLPLPVGISFFTFQAMAYVIDVRRGEPVERSPLRFGTFILYFPQLIAGPIVRRHELMPQLMELPWLKAEQVARGLYRIGLGMAKKLLIADIIKLGMVDPLFADPGRFSTMELMLALYGYTIQIYYDFSAYTDIAIGSARLMGIELPENFRRPYKATCVAGFWRRWHITLSNWVRDYVYFPMGGAKADAQWKVYRNLMLTLLIIGVWHGASWNFVVYGLLHGTASCINRWRRKKTGRKPDDPLPNALAWAWRWALTFHFVVLARVLFRSDTLGGAVEYLEAMENFVWAIPRFSYTALGVFAAGFALHFTPESWERRMEALFVRGGPALQAAALAGVAWACATFGSGESLAFIYYQF